MMKPRIAWECSTCKSLTMERRKIRPAKCGKCNGTSFTGNIFLVWGSSR